VFSSPLDYGDLWEVWVDHPDRMEKLPVGHDASDLAVSPAGNRLAFSQNRSNVNIWRVDLGGPQPRAQKVIFSTREQTSPDLSPDGSQVAFQSNRSGSNEIWVSSVDGSGALQLSSFGINLTGTPRWSPDGKQIVFASGVSGQSEVYLADPHGSIPHKLDIDIHGNYLPSWSHDGQWIYFVNGEDAYHPTGWKVSSTGGRAIPIAKGDLQRPIESPDGKYVYFVRDWRLWSVMTDGTGEQQVPGMPEMAFSGWTPFGSGLYFIAMEGGKLAIKFFDLQTKKTHVVYVLEKKIPSWFGGMPISSDGKWLLFPQQDEVSSDLMLIENWR
jgi:Tol biopolymer transport system component